ncbi:hypothetical protein [Rhizobium leguminosarum]|uniref:Uncharacterized protein n=1 Tax=Rhizobium leguminosarum TaxID=384 RepID=A0A2K9ZF44_RHILE|nr:hypothetical protein [Rhizobium leguminosarum]AUW46856.1 hypothetical protein CUJ84_pRLN2000317 [Rhizobium leguminosarum]
MSSGGRSFQLRYVGKRFDGARLPLEVLSDLPAFRDLLAAYAKESWRVSHRGRKRLPRGFDGSITFDLVAIDEGSAMPRLDWSRETAQELLPGFDNELDVLVGDSFSKIVDLIDNAGVNKFPSSLPSEQIRALNRLGAGLRPGERIEFLGSTGADGKVVYLDTHRRKSLITQVRETYQTRFDGFGILTGIHIDGMLQISTKEYGEIDVRVDRDRVAEEFDGNIGSPVQISIQIELDDRDVYRSVVDVYDLDVIDEKVSEEVMKCRERLNELRDYRSGWLDGSGEPPSAAAIKAAETFLAKRPFQAVAYKLFPTPSGGVVFELDVGGWDYSVEFPSDGSVEMYGIEVDGTDEILPERFDAVGDEFLEFFDLRTGK